MTVLRRDFMPPGVWVNVCTFACVYACMHVSAHVHENWTNIQVPSSTTFYLSETGSLTELGVHYLVGQ